MAVTLRERRTAYDNISVGNATGSERTIAGAARETQTWGQGENIQVGTDYGEELIIEKATALLEGENVAVGG